MSPIKYPPPYHQSHDREKMITVIKAFPFAMLVSVREGKPLITHIPIIYNDTSGRLVAHIDKYNPQVETLRDGHEVAVVFRGPDTYISPSVYTTKQLPTWNYIYVHITGLVRTISDPVAAKETMVAMTKFLEQPDHKFVLEKDNPRMHRMINYIQAFDIEIIQWEGKFKLSQDKNETDQEMARLELIKNATRDISGFVNEIYR